MLPKCYIELQPSSNSADLPGYAVLEKTQHILHGAFADLGKYAISFPDSKQGTSTNKKRSMGNVIRIFAETSQDLYDLIEKIKGHHVVRDNIQMSVPIDVPEDFKGTWSVWRRTRVAQGRSEDRKRSVGYVEKAIFCEMRSSKGHVFPLRVYREKGVKPKDDFSPSSYGLASLKNMYALPDI